LEPIVLGRILVCTNQGGIAEVGQLVQDEGHDDAGGAVDGDGDDHQVGASGQDVVVPVHPFRVEAQHVSRMWYRARKSR